MNETERRRWNERIFAAAQQDPILAELDDSQQRAACCFEDRTIVTAGAGSGKTRTMVAKATYAVERLGADPTQIAFVTFTSKAAAEIRSRTKDRLPGLAVGTIHQLARAVLQNAGAGEVQMTPMAEDQAVRIEAIEGWLKEETAADPSLIADRRIRLNAVQPAPATPDRADRRLRVPPANTPVKSMGELEIGTLLHAAGITYKYEAKFPLRPEDRAPGEVRDYNPDFYIPDDPRVTEVRGVKAGVWLEHYAHDRWGRVPSHFEGYDRERTWKRELHARLETRYIETSFGDLQRMWDGDGPRFADVLVEKLRSVGVKVDDPEWWTADGVRGEPPDAGTRLSREVDKWVGMDRRRPPGTAPALEPDSGAAALRRLGQRVLARYETELKRTGTDDHDGTILRAIEAARSRPDLIPWDHVIVDEYQDVNPAQSAFVHALTTPKAPGRPGATLAGVGDDWQAIFGFQGGDPRLIASGHDPGGKVRTECTRINLTNGYRYGRALANAARTLTDADPHCSERLVAGIGPEPIGGMPAVEVTSCQRTPETSVEAGRTPATTGLLTAIEHWIPVHEGPNEDPEEPLTLIVMGRRNADVLDPPPDGKHVTGIDRRVVDRAAAAVGIRTDYRTIHAAKGGEADYAILIDSGPSAARARAAEQALAKAIAEETGYADEDEHRLWYVAITRAKRAALILVGDREGGTSRATETLIHAALNARDAQGLEENTGDGHTVRTQVHQWLEPVKAPAPCPGCNRDGAGKGRLRSKTTKSGRHFAGCSEWNADDDESCGYTQPACGTCGNGVLEAAGPVFRCQTRECGAEVPACRCRPPVPMTVRRQKKSGDRFWGCWRYGEPDACGKTMTID